MGHYGHLDSAVRRKELYCSIGKFGYSLLASSEEYEWMGGPSSSSESTRTGQWDMMDDVDDGDGWGDE